MYEKCARPNTPFAVIASRHGLDLSTFFRVYKRWITENESDAPTSAGDVVIPACTAGLPRALTESEERLLAATAKQIAKGGHPLSFYHFREAARHIIDKSPERFSTAS